MIVFRSCLYIFVHKEGKGVQNMSVEYKRQVRVKKSLISKV